MKSFFQDLQGYILYISINFCLIQEANFCGSNWPGSTYSLPLIYFRFLISWLMDGRATMCIKSCLRAFSIGKQWEAHLKLYVGPALPPSRRMKLEVPPLDQRKREKPSIQRKKDFYESKFSINSKMVRGYLKVNSN